MSVKTCIRIIPSILRHTNCKNIFIIQNCNLLCKNSGCLKSSTFPNLSQNVRFLSMTENKSTVSADESQQVYNGILTPQLRAVKLFSLATSFAGIAAQPIMYKEISSLGSVPMVIVVCSFIGFFTVVTPFLLHFIAKKYITTLTYKPKTGTYVATTLNFFNVSQELEFTPEDVKVPDVPGMFTTFLVKGKPLFVDPRLFKDPTHYGKLMGYDKPLDLKLFQTSLNEKKK